MFGALLGSWKACVAMASRLTCLGRPVATRRPLVPPCPYAACQHTGHVDVLARRGRALERRDIQSRIVGPRRPAAHRRHDVCPVRMEWAQLLHCDGPACLGGSLDSHLATTVQRDRAEVTGRIACKRAFCSLCLHNHEARDRFPSWHDPSQASLQQTQRRVPLAQFFRDNGGNGVSAPDGRDRRTGGRCPGRN